MGNCQGKRPGSVREGVAVTRRGRGRSNSLGEGEDRYADYRLPLLSRVRPTEVRAGGGQTKQTVQSDDDTGG